MAISLIIAHTGSHGRPTPQMDTDQILYTIGTLVVPQGLSEMPGFSRRTLFILVVIGGLSFGLTAHSSSQKTAPDFSLPRLDSAGQVSLGDYKGRVVYVDFWATWCAPCRKSFPWMEEMHQQYHQDGLTIVAISVDAKRDLAEKFIQEFHPSFINAHDPDKKTARLYKLRAMPSSYLIDRDGNIVSTHVGFRTSHARELETEIKKLLGK